MPFSDKFASEILDQNSKVRTKYMSKEEIEKELNFNVQQAELEELFDRNKIITGMQNELAQYILNTKEGKEYVGSDEFKEVKKICEDKMKPYGNMKTN